MSSISERFKNPTSYQRQVDEVEHAASGTGSRASSVSGSRASSVSGSRRPSNASSQEGNFISELSETVGITPAIARSSRNSATRPRKVSTSSENYAGTFIPENIGEQFSNVRTPARRTPALNTEQRNFVAENLRNQGIDPNHLSPVNQEILRGRHSGIQRHDGVSTRSIRAETSEPHQQLDMGIQTRGRGRPQTNTYPRPIGPTRPRGRPRSTNLSQAQTPPQEIFQTPRRGVTRKMG